MKMIDTETGHEMVEVSGHDKKEYASNEDASSDKVWEYFRVI